MSKANANGQNYANLKNIWHHTKYMKQYNVINDPTYPFVDNSTINSPNPTGWGQYSGHNTVKNSCGCDVELKPSTVENMCSSCSGYNTQLEYTSQSEQTGDINHTSQSEQISNQQNATKATTKSTNQDIKKKKETYFSPLTHDFCNATKGGKKLAF